jgi:hypothetical protein
MLTLRLPAVAGIPSALSSGLNMISIENRFHSSADW